MQTKEANQQIDDRKCWTKPFSRRRASHHFRDADFESGRSDSGSRKTAIANAIAESPAATNPDRDPGCRCHRPALRNRQTSGPSVNPNPNATPINAIPRVRFSFVVVSAIYAWAVGMVAPAMPAPIRVTNKPKQALVNRGNAEQGIKHDTAGQADHDHRPATDAIRQRAPNRGEQKLHDRKTGHQHANHKATGVGAELIGVQGQ